MASSSVRQLTQELKSLQKEPVEGFQISLPNEANIYLWDVIVFGPPGTLYEGGYFKASLYFPQNYPYSPPVFRFKTKISHPNILSNGEVCISTLQLTPRGPYVFTKNPSELWSPAKSVRTILLSSISLLTEPISKDYKPQTAASVKMYEAAIRKQTEASRVQAEAEGIKVPTTEEEYRQTAATVPESAKDSQDESDFREDDLDQDYLYQSDAEEDAYESMEEEANEEDESAEEEANEEDESAEEEANKKD